jgi:putative NADH-flavin reductase
MNIAVIGASAGIGRETVQQALDGGHSVRALSRNNDTLPEHRSLTKVQGTVLSVEDLKKAITGTDAVLVTIGTKKKKGTTLFSDAAKAIVKATSDLNYDGNVIIVTGFGVGESAGYLSFFLRLIINLLLKDQYTDKTRMQEIITNSQMNWEIVMPGILTNGPLTSDYKVMSELSEGMKIGKISRKNVAHYLLKEAEHAKILYHQIALTS